MSLLVKFNLILILCFAIAIVPAHLITKDLLERNARAQVVAHARLMMQTALATRGYTNKQIKPLLASRLAEEFYETCIGQGHAAARSRSYAGQGQIAYAPVAEWLRSSLIGNQVAWYKLARWTPASLTPCAWLPALSFMR